MLHFLTYIDLVVYTFKTRQNIFVFCLRIQHFDILVYFGKCMYCYYLYIWVYAILWKWRAYSKYSIYHVLLCHIKYWHTIKEGKVTLDRSPELCLKPLIYRYLLKTGHAPGDPLAVPFLTPEPYFVQIEILSTGWCYILNIRALDLVVSNKRVFLYLFNMSM